MGSHRKSRLALGRSPEPERPEIVHGEVVEPGTDVELARRQAREVEDSGGWHYQDRGNSIPWDIVMPGVLLILLWVGLCTYVVLRWKQLV